MNMDRTIINKYKNEKDRVQRAYDNYNEEENINMF